MTRLKLTGVALVAVFAMSACVASAASAAKFVVKGGTAKAHYGLATSATTEFVLKSTVGTNKEEVVISCEKVESKGAFLENETANDGAEAIIFTVCKTSKPTGCKLGNAKGESTTIITTASVVTLLEESGSNFYDKFTPKAGATTAFVTVSLLGCAAEGLYEIKGSARAEGTKTEGEKVEGSHLLKFTSASGSALTFGANSATLTGTAKETIEGGKEYSIKP